jgi:uncharacterized damage-inducible protein DinB
MEYPAATIPTSDIPTARNPLLQHVADTYASEINKVASVWLEFGDGDLGYRPDERSSTVEAILKHQLLSERRFFGEFLGLPEPPAAEVLPPAGAVRGYVDRLGALARRRLDALAGRDDAWWLERVSFFDVERERIWIFWRRVLHTAHHRTQLTVYLRLLGRRVPPVYGPTADATWTGADPTASVDAAGRR